MIAGGRETDDAVCSRKRRTFFLLVSHLLFSPAKLVLDWIMIMNYEDNEILTWQKSDGLFLYGYGASCTGYLRPGGWQYCKWSTSDSWRLSTSRDSDFFFFFLLLF